VKTTTLPFGWPPQLIMRRACEYTGLSRWALYHAMKAGELRAIGRRGRTYVFERAELDAWMSGANSELRPTPTPKRTLAAGRPRSNALDRVRRIARGGDPR
jgi:excisionase family DNA binding protein